EASYPLLRVAFAEQQIAAGKEVSAWGEFDLTAKAYSIAAPLGFYKTYRSLVELNQPMYGGGYVYSGYKIGDGKFQPWFKERETNEGGEFSAGFGVPLLKNRQIDQRRSEVMQAALARQATQPFTQAQLLLFNQEAAYSYWSWVAAGRSTRAAEALVDLGLQRVGQVKERVAAGDLAPIADIDNQRLIADRETKLIETARKFQASAIKLSLFLRDAAGQPMIAELAQVPDEVPPLTEIDAAQLESDIASAIAARPEIAEIDFEVRRVRVQIAEANNSMLPKLDAAVGAAQDIGNPTNSIGDKTPFELEAGLYGEVPLQRRQARGKRMAANAKLRQLCAKREFIVNKVTVAVQDAHSALQAAEMRIERAELNANLAEQSLQLARDRFNAGDIDLIVLNIYEKAVTDAQLVLIDAESDYFKAVADYRAALAQPAGSETN
ncbi:MAG: TolC family protein, partial [Planctomycetales bacterium]|nr:TolC family protein [Planctomycetales bacterium]